MMPRANNGLQTQPMKAPKDFRPTVRELAHSCFRLYGMLTTGERPTDESWADADQMFWRMMVQHGVDRVDVSLETNEPINFIPFAKELFGVLSGDVGEWWLICGDGARLACEVIGRHIIKATIEPVDLVDQEYAWLEFAISKQGVENG